MPDLNIFSQLRNISLNGQRILDLTCNKVAFKKQRLSTIKLYKKVAVNTPVTTNSHNLPTLSQQ